MLVIGGFGNPLLDVSVRLADGAILAKHRLEEDGQKQTDEGEMRSLLGDVAGEERSQTPGGCAQNTLRVLQWLLGSSGATVMFGAVGGDERGEALKLLVEGDGVRTCYATKEPHPTGTSLALIRGPNRSLVAHLGAAERLTVADLRAPPMSDALEEVGAVYVEGFFLTKRKEPALHVLRHCQASGKLLAFNLSAVYMCEGEDSALVARFASECDVLFGNRREFAALADAVGWRGTVEALSEKLATKRTGLKRAKTVVVTDGAREIHCVCGDAPALAHPVPRLDVGEIKDTTGAGDAFVAGFLAGLLLKGDPETALRWGCYAAQQIVRQVGCRVPEAKPELVDQ